MEEKSQSKEKNKEIKRELPSGRVRRPKSFSFKRRDAVYFFSERSTRGILKSVPVRSESFRMDELLTVVEKSDVAKIRNEIWSEVPLSSETLESDKNTAGKNDSYQSVPQDKKKKPDLKLLDETERNELWSKALKKLSILEAYEESLKTKIDDKKPLKDINQNEDVFYKSFEALEKKRKESKYFEDIDSKNLKGCLGKLCENTSGSNKRRDSLRNPDESNREILHKTWTEGSLREALGKMSIKPPITEL